MWTKWNRYVLVGLMLSAWAFSQTEGDTSAMDKIKAEADTTNSVGMTFRKIPGKPYLMQSTELTQAQWVAVMSSNPSYYKGDEVPVSKICWNDAKAFVDKLNAMGEGTYRLPTEAEWEHAYRAGTTTEFYWGDAMDGAYCWFTENSNNRPNPVGRTQPNAWGLYDMAGNVWEFCAEENGTMRVMRGGSYSSAPKHCAATGQGVGSATRKANGFGIRLIREAD